MLPPDSTGPADAGIAFDTALAAHRRGDLATAKAGYEAVLARAPDHVGALQMLGSLALQTGNRAPALALFRRVAELRPDVAESHNNLAAALVTSGRYREALPVFRRAAALDPADATAVSNMGVALVKLGEPVKALTCQRQAVAIDPGFALGHQRLGELLDRSGDLAGAIASFRQALALAPPTGEGLAGLGSALLQRGEVAAAITALRDAARLLPDQAAIAGNLCLTLLYGDQETPASLWRAHRDWAMRFGGAARQITPHDNDRDPERPLRVGYVSPDFREHSVAHFLEPLLAHHDRDRIRVHGYAEVARPDHRTARLQALCDGWTVTVGLDDAVLDRQVRADRIDLLVDLCGLFNGNRLTLISRRPAPVQLSWLGYPATTGLDVVDARLSDADLTPTGGPERWSETLVRLPRPYLAYQPPAAAPDPGPPPCLAAGHVTFGSFNSLAKLSEATVALWARVLATVPRARLLLKSSGGMDPQTGALTVSRFADRGIDPARIETVGFIDDPAGHLALYRRVDIGLDPHPYNGTTTTCEALWMGVPVVTLAGDMGRSRNGVTLLRAVGLDGAGLVAAGWAGTDPAETNPAETNPAWRADGLIADDADAYVGCAVALAAQPDRLAAIRAGLRDRMRRSPLCDAAGFARAVEDAYRRLWRDWCRRGPAG